MTGEWWRDGLRFSCSQCGNCCTGGEGAVWFTPDEGRSMAAQLKMSESDFLETHTRIIGNRRSLNEHQTEHGFDCGFLDRTSQPGKALCRVYLARPTQCRTWPFWASNLTSPAAWDRAKKTTPCQGMNEGKLFPADKIRIIRDADEKDNAAAPW